MQRSKLFCFYQLKLVYVVYEVFKTSVKVSLSRQQHYMLEVRVIDMRINSKKSFENHFNDVHKVSREWNTKLAGENFFVIELGLNPCHQKIYVFRGTNFERSFNVLTIRPEILVLGPGTHSWAGLGSAKLG